MKKSDVGMMQEQLPNGKVTTSLMRWMSILSLAVLFIYMYLASKAYDVQLDKYINLVSQKVITEQSFNALVGELHRFEQWIVFSLLAGAFAPKAIQKAIENWALTKTPSQENQN